MYALSDILRKRTFPIFKGVRLIQSSSLGEIIIQWTLLLYIQAVALVPIASIVLIGYFLTLSRSLSITEFYLLVWSFFEFIFFGFCCHLQNKIQPYKPAPVMTQAERMYNTIQLFEWPERVTSFLFNWFSIPDGQKFLIENLKTFLSWSLFDKNLHNMTKPEFEQLNELVEYGFTQNPNFLDRNESDKKHLPCLMLNHDPVVVQHKPLSVYILIWVAQFTGSVTLMSMGFRKFTATSNVNYWVYTPSKITGEPIIFLHGIGIGLLMYCRMIRDLIISNQNRQIILPEFPFVSLSLNGDVPDRDSMIQALDLIIKSHNINKCTWIGHSYGTSVATWIAKLRPEYISNLTLIDPVCFLLWEPSLIINFLYCAPSSFLHFFIQFFVSQDLYVSYTLRRNFIWHQNVLYPEDIQNLNTNIFLSEEDFIVNAPIIHEYLSRANKKLNLPQMQLFLVPQVSHGAYLYSPWYSNLILDHV